MVHMLHSVNVGRRDRRPLKDFLPQWDWEPERPQTPQEMMDIAKRWTLLLGGKVAEKPGA